MPPRSTVKDPVCGMEGPLIGLACLDSAEQLLFEDERGRQQRRHHLYG